MDHYFEKKIGWIKLSRCHIQRYNFEISSEGDEENLEGVEANGWCVGRPV
jgi:hypothetical protein